MRSVKATSYSIMSSWSLLFVISGSLCSSKANDYSATFNCFTDLWYWILLPTYVQHHPLSFILKQHVYIYSLYFLNLFSFLFCCRLSLGWQSEVLGCSWSVLFLKFDLEIWLENGQPVPQLHLGSSSHHLPDHPDAVHLLQLPRPVVSRHGRSGAHQQISWSDIQLRSKLVIFCCVVSKPQTF